MLAVAVECTPLNFVFVLGGRGRVRGAPVENRDVSFVGDEKLATWVWYCQFLGFEFDLAGEWNQTEESGGDNLHEHKVNKQPNSRIESLPVVYQHVSGTCLMDRNRPILSSTSTLGKQQKTRNSRSVYTTQP